MDINVGGRDRLARYLVGVLLILAGLLGYTGTLQVAVGPLPQALTAVALALVGLVLVITAWTRRCPVNEATGRNTAD